MPKMLKLKEAAELTGLSYNYLRNLCLNNEIKHIKCGNRFVISEDILKAFLNGDGNVSGLD